MGRPHRHLQLEKMAELLSTVTRRGPRLPIVVGMTDMTNSSSLSSRGGGSHHPNLRFNNRWMIDMPQHSSNRLIGLPPIMGQVITDHHRALLDRVVDMTILQATLLAMASNSAIAPIKESGRDRVSQIWKAHQELQPSMKWYDSICERDKWGLLLSNSSHKLNLIGNQKEVFDRSRPILSKLGEIEIETESAKCICVNATERMSCMTVGTHKATSYLVEGPDLLHLIARKNIR